MDKHDIITPEYLHKRLRYDAETGKLFWLYGKRKYFSCQRGCSIFNAKYSGKEALTCINSWGYLSGAINKKAFLAHRVIWAMAYGKWPTFEIDHINGIKTDNRIANLREVTGAENRRNMPLPANNTSGFIGVSKKGNRWIARIGAGGRNKRIYIGVFDTIDEAIEARKLAEISMGYSRTHGRD